MYSKKKVALKAYISIWTRESAFKNFKVDIKKLVYKD